MKSFRDSFHFIVTVLSVIVLCCLINCVYADLQVNDFANSTSSNKTKRSYPNIVIYLADDLGYGDINQQSQEYGFERFSEGAINISSIISTPNLEKMAREGLRLFNSYASASLCGPSRHSLMTGLNVGRTRNRGGIYPDGNLRNDETKTLPWALQTLGYRTGIVGKWGLGETFGVPWRNGFDVFFGFLSERDAHRYFSYAIWEYNSSASLLPSSMRNQKEVVLNTITLKGNSKASGALCRTINFTNETSRGPCQYTPDEVNKYAQEFIRSSVKAKVPFFLYWCPQTPHSGLYLPVDVVFQAYTSPVPTFGTYKGKQYDSWLNSVRGKASMITDTLDRDIGTLMSLLKEVKQDENTLVIFLSDNGPDDSDRYDKVDDVSFLQSTAGLSGRKRSLYEGGLKSPSIIWWPGKIEAGQISRFPTAHYDIPLTILDGIKAPMSIRSIFDRYADQPGAAESLAKEWGILKKEPGYQMLRTDLYFELCALGDERDCNWVMMDLTEYPNTIYKLIRYPDVENDDSSILSRDVANISPLLFNITDDPIESNPLDLNEYASKVEELMTRQKNARFPLCPSSEELIKCPLFKAADACQAPIISFHKTPQPNTVSIECIWCKSLKSCIPGGNANACSQDRTWYSWC